MVSQVNGKSSFATKLGKVLSIPIHHLDKHMFDGRTKRDKQEFLSIKEALVKEESYYRGLFSFPLPQNLKDSLPTVEEFEAELIKE